MLFKIQSKAGRKLFLSAYLCVLKSIKTLKIRNKGLQILIFMINYSIYMQLQVYCSDKGEIHIDKKVYCKRTKAFYRIFAAAACSLLLAGCQAQKPDDYATNQGYSDNSTVSVQNTTGITKKISKSGSFICLIRQRKRLYLYT